MYLTSVPSLLQTIFPSAIWSSEEEPRFKLTFDDGPHPDSTPKLLACLKTKNIKATFFCLGEQLEKHPDLHQAMKDAGHIVANHGYRHLSGWTTDYQDYLTNADHGAELSESNYFRPPYGRMTPRQYHQIKDKYKIVMWTAMPGDFDEQTDKEAISIKVQKAYKENEIIVLHDTLACLDKILFALNELS